MPLATIGPLFTIVPRHTDLNFLKHISQVLSIGIRDAVVPLALLILILILIFISERILVDERIGLGMALGAGIGIGHDGIALCIDKGSIAGLGLVDEALGNGDMRAARGLVGQDENKWIAVEFVKHVAVTEELHISRQQRPILGGKVIDEAPGINRLRNRQVLLMRDTGAGIGIALGAGIGIAMCIGLGMALGIGRGCGIRLHGSQSAARIVE